MTKPRVRSLVELFAEAQMAEDREEDDADQPRSGPHGGPCGRRERLKWLIETEDDIGTKDDAP